MRADYKSAIRRIGNLRYVDLAAAALLHLRLRLMQLCLSSLKNPRGILVCSALVLLCALPAFGAAAHQESQVSNLQSPIPASLPSLEEAMAARTDLWGELAMRQTNGPSYEFFAPILPPLRYVNADFRCYPIVLSAPNANAKARLIANGSGLNLRGGARAWNDVGTEVRFRVGPDEFLFGGLPDRVSQPTLAEGWLPIVEIRYLHPTPLQPSGQLALAASTPKAPPEIYRLEAFAATEPALASNGVVFVRFDLAQGSNGTVTVQVDGAATIAGEKPNGDYVGPITRLAALFDPQWKLGRGRYTARLTARHVRHARRRHQAAQPLLPMVAPSLRRAPSSLRRHLARPPRPGHERPNPRAHRQ